MWGKFVHILYAPLGRDLVVSPFSGGMRKKKNGMLVPVGLTRYKNEKIKGKYGQKLLPSGGDRPRKKGALALTG